MGSLFSTKSDTKSTTKKAADAVKKGGKKVVDKAKGLASKIKKKFTKSGFYDYSSEPAWMRSISNSNISNWFYIFFVINALLFVLSLLFIIMKLFSRGSKVTIMNAVPVILAGAFSAVNTLFFYLLSDRSLP